MQLAHSPSVANASRLPEGALSYFPAQPHGSRLLRWRLSRGTVRSRTNSQRKSQDMARPREAHAGRTIPGKDYYVGTGGVQRAFAHHASPVGTSPQAKVMGKR